MLLKHAVKNNRHPEEKSVTPTPLKRVEPLRIPDHELLRPIGEGSYGAVWLARSVMGTLRAVKIVYRGSFTDERPYEREFRGMQKFEPLSRTHDGFVDILQIGRDDAAGYFYYIMELADDAAEPRAPGHQCSEISKAVGEQSALNAELLITGYCPKTLRAQAEQRGRLPVETCLAIGVSLAAALEHLHRNGLVHRDIKPSNIIFVNGQPKLADIGLVAGLDDARSFVGTEGFIPPEGPGAPQGDLYSLGKVLYEISSGKDRRAYPDPPTRLGEFHDLDQLLELDEVLRKACDPDSRNRYQRAEELHADLLLLQAGQSVRRLHLLERHLARVTRASVVAALVLAVAIPGFLFALYEKHQAVAASLRAQVAEADSKEKLWGSYLAQSQALRSGHRADKRFAGLELMQKAAVIRADILVRNEAIACMAIPGVRAGREWKTTFSLESTIDLESKPYLSMESDKAGNISVRQFEEDHEILRLPGFGSPVYGLSLTGDRHFLGAGYYGFANPTNPPAQIWDLTGHEGWMPPAVKIFRCMDFTKDGTRAAIASMNDGPVTLYDLRSKSPLWSFQPKRLPTSLAFDRAGRRLAVPSAEESALQILDADTGKALPPLIHPAGVFRVAWHPEGDLLAAACANNDIYLWNTKTAKVRNVLTGHEFSVTRVSFSHSGRLLASAGWDGYLRLWDIAIGKEIGSARFDGSSGVFSGDDRWLGEISAKKIRLCEVASGQELKFLSYGEMPGNQTWICDFSPDGTLLVVGYNDGVRFWDAKTGAQLRFLPMEHARALFLPTGRSLLTCSRSGIQEWPIEWSASNSARPLKIGPPEMLGPEGVLEHALDRQGKLLLSVRGGRIHVFDLQSKTDRSLSAVGVTLHTGCISPDGRWCAACAYETNKVFIFDVPSGHLSKILAADGVAEEAFSPDGSLLVTCSLDEYRFWNTAHWSSSFSISRTNIGGMHGSIAFAPDGTMAAIAATSHLIRLVDPGTGREFASLEGYDSQAVGNMAFSPDGTQLAMSGWNHPTQLWDLRLIRNQLGAMGVDWSLPPYPSVPNLTAHPRPLARAP
jgi:WD40 repeat protein